MREEGKMLTCDRCKESAFLKFLKKVETDGGYTRYNEYEDAPEGWGYVFIGNDISKIDLCPSCYTSYLLTMHDFLNCK